MNRNFLKLYNSELFHVRQMASEFAREYPKIAGRLALEPDAKESCADPFVERLLEGFAYLTARVQLKLEAEFPRFTQSILESVYPHYLCPTPSMTVVRLEPDPQDAGSPEGFLLKRHSVLRSQSSEGGTQCEFRTAHAVQIWPLRIIESRYYTRDIAQLELPASVKGRAAIRVRIQANPGVKMKALLIDRLPVFIRGHDETPSAILEQLFSRGGQVVVKTPKDQGNIVEVLPSNSVRRKGLSEEEALLPYAPRGFEGYRLLQEYFALPERFRFFEFTGLKEAIAKCDSSILDLIIVLNEAEPALENRIDNNTFELHCTPAVNLFPKRLDPISLLDRFSEFHVVADRTQPLDYEIYQISGVTGQGSTAESEQVFQPFYLARNDDLVSSAYYSINRVPRLLSAREKREGATSQYVGSDVFISLVDGEAAPYRSDLLQLYISALCTNRHLPIQLTTGIGKTDFVLETYAPVSSVRCLTTPTTPAAAHTDGELAWRTISHLSLNYLSILDDSRGNGASALRELLGLYSDGRDIRAKRQIEGLRSVTSAPIVRRVELPGPLTFARGVEITVTFDETAFEGSGIYVIGSVLERFFARYVALNSFTETVIVSQQRGEIIRWKTQPGQRQII